MTGVTQSTQSVAQIMLPVVVPVAVDSVVNIVLAEMPHPLMVVQTSVVMLCTVELPAVPEKNDVDSVTVSVQYGTAELSVHVGEAELVGEGLVADDCDFEGEWEGLLSSSCKLFPISLRVSVRFSISDIGGTGASTALTRLSTTCNAQLTRFAASLTRLVSPEIKLLLVIKSLKSLSVIVLLFLFSIEQSGFGTGLTFRDLKRESVFSLTFLTLSIYSCFDADSVIRFRSA